MKTAITAPMMKSVTKARRPKAVEVRREQQGRADHEAAADCDQDDQGREAAEDQDDRRPVEAVAGGQIAAPSADGVADGKQHQACRDHDGHDLGAEVVRRQDLKLAHVPPDDSGQDEKNEGDDETRHVGAPLGRCAHGISQKRSAALEDAALPTGFIVKS